MVDIISQSQSQDEGNIEAMIDDALKKSMSKMLKKTDKFAEAARLSMTKETICCS